MKLLVRTWNLFHGRTWPESRRIYLEPMVQLVTRDEPDLVALQEVPLWALRRLDAWSGMHAWGTVAKRALLGPSARRLQKLDPVHVRSPFTGQANAVLVRRDLKAAQVREVVLARRPRWERRVCQILLLQVSGETLELANVHATAQDERRARRDMQLVAMVLGTDGPAVVCGDFNVPEMGLPGFSAPIAGIDQILVRGLEFERSPEPWSEERRRIDGVLLSDHAPVEAVVA